MNLLCNVATAKLITGHGQWRTMTANMSTHISSLVKFPPMYAAGSTNYSPIPDSVTLEKVVVIHRHGDRSQISRHLGDCFPESNANFIADFWKSKMPSTASFVEMMNAAARTEKGTENNVQDLLNATLYSGWDKDTYPFGQLTEVGFQQLKAVGKLLHQRYEKSLKLPVREEVASEDWKSRLFLRSTNSCRTVQSLRSLLAGLTTGTSTRTGNGSGQNSNGNTPLIHTIEDASKLPMIQTRPKELETLFPQASGPCAAMNARKSVLFDDYDRIMNQSIPNYSILESRMKTLLGPSYENKVVPWIYIKEILTCHVVHGVSLPENMTIADEQDLTLINSFIWGRIFNVRL